ncbi:NF-kappa-B essential modulator [Achroia grisella]|uniref:NF-kappa-B essential modulator n=1 Tax=Achroia grisella TaxID=688607 RepID=UPI0027D2844C|nr:NF-kappa-B essential modulator [Achroia grisella]
MESRLDNGDDESFIVLGTSPGTSLDLKCEGMINGHGSFDKIQMEDALKDLSIEAKSSLKAHFRLGDSPSPGSLMAASSIITDDKTTEELQKRFGELLDENVILKETLKQNNDSMKEQFLLIASCQEDMMKTHTLHKEKFVETKELVEKLRHENKKLKQDLARLVDVEQTNGETSRSPPSSGVEFVTSPDDDTINKLTAQLELVEKQRRQVIVDNEKLTWQKESLEHVVDATTKERDDLKEQLQKAQLQLTSKDNKYENHIQSLNSNIQELQIQIDAANSVSSLSSEEMTKRDSTIRQLEAKVTYFQTELKDAQLKLLNYENVKLEYMRQKSALSETIKMYKDQIDDLKTKLKDTQTITFQPVRVSITPDQEPSSSSNELATFASNIKLYDKTLKYLSEHLNGVTHGLVDNIVETMGVVASLCDFKLERDTTETFKSGLIEVQRQLQKQHSNALNNISHIRSTLSIFEGIFKDHKELLQKARSKQECVSNSQNVETLTAALLARGSELQTVQAELKQLRLDVEDNGAFKVQMELYKADFEAEREAREKMACEKENIAADLRNAQRRIEYLTNMLEEARRTQSSPAATPTRPPPSSQNATNSTRKVHKKQKVEGKTEELPRETTPPPQKYRCPVCDKEFKTMILLQQHVDSCLL